MSILISFLENLYCWSKWWLTIPFKVPELTPSAVPMTHRYKPFVSYLYCLWYVIPKFDAFQHFLFFIFMKKKWRWTKVYHNTLRVCPMSWYPLGCYLYTYPIWGAIFFCRWMLDIGCHIKFLAYFEGLFTMPQSVMEAMSMFLKTSLKNRFLYVFAWYTR